MPNSLAEQAKNITDAKISQVKEQIDTFYKELVVSTPVSVLPENIFKELFLEFFMNGGISNGTAPLTLKWLELAGGPYNEVNIIDNKGNVVFTTPGLYCKPETETGDINFADIASNYNLRANRLQADGVNYLNASLSGVGNRVSTETPTHIVRWNNIFKRYTNPGIQTTTKRTPLHNDTADFLNYD